VCAAWVAAGVGCCALYGGAAWADNRTDVVNRANAKHLSGPKADPASQHRESPPDEAAPDETAADDADEAPAPDADAQAAQPGEGQAAASPETAIAQPAAPEAAPDEPALDDSAEQAEAAEAAARRALAALPPAEPASADVAVVEPAPAAASAAPADSAEEDASAAPPEPHWTPVGSQPGNCCECSGRCGTYEFNGPLAIVGQHPPSVLFYEPMPDVATVLAPGASTVSTNIDLTNHIIRELDSGTVVDYDFEQLRLTLDYRRRLGSGEFGARTHLDYRSHGVMDPIIANWHQFFGLHNGLRSSYPDYQYHYTVITRDGVAYNGVGDVFGLGDLALSYKYPLWDHRDGHDAAALRAGVKVPLGDSADALGSGNWDYSLGALWQRQFTQRLRGYVNVDYVQTGAPDWPNIRQHSVLHTMWGAEYAWSHRFSLVTQYSTATNALITGSYEADKDPRELTVGFNHRIGPHVVWSGGFREDISPEASPDFALLSHFRWEF
jgi:hypothetical protein